MKITLEIAVSTPDEALAVVKAGANRLELSSGLDVGGLTPSMGLFARVRSLVTVPVYVLLRPRPGGFSYSDDEMEVVLHDADEFLAAGADGVVFGALNEDGTVAVEACRHVVERSRGRIVFHRALDFTPNLPQALDQLIALGFERVLTSGGKTTAREGSAVLSDLMVRSAGRIEILPGGGIRPGHVAELVRATGCDQVHAAARGIRTDSSLQKNLALALAMGADHDGNRTTTDVERVAGLRAALDRLTSLR